MITIAMTEALIPGVHLEPTSRGAAVHRLPSWVRQQFPDPQLLAMESQPSGVRIALRTEARSLRLRVHSSRLAYTGAPRPRGAIDVFVDQLPHHSDVLTGGDTLEVSFDGDAPTFVAGDDHLSEIQGLSPGSKRVDLWLPHNESIEIVALEADAPVRPAEPIGPIWVHHGSSISHGSNAATPSRIWPAVAARIGRVELRNLGLGGSAMVDPFLARVIAEQPADLISLKLGINVVNGDVMRRRAFEPAVHGFLDTIRDRHPRTPIVLISPIFCGIHEHTPGPGIVEPSSLGSGQIRFGASGDPADVATGRLTLTAIRDLLAGVVSRRDDPHLHHLDGTSLYAAADAETLPLPDELHPDTATHDLIGRRFAEFAFGADGPFAAQPRQM